MKKIIMLFVFLALAGVFFMQKSNFKTTTVPAKPTQLGLPVETATVTKATITASVKYSGTVAAKEEATLASKIAGRIEELTVSEGDAVQKGQVVITLEKNELVSKLNTLKQKLTTAKQNLDYWEEQLAKYDVLWQEGAIPEDKYNQIKFARDNAANAYKEVYAMLQEASVNLASATISAPLDGVVTAVLALPGDMATPGKPILKIADVKDLKAQVRVIEGDLVRIKEGSPVYISVANSDFPPVTAKVNKIFPALDPVTRTAVVEAVIPEQAFKANRVLRPGMSIEANFVLGQQEQALVIPKKAVKWENGKPYVFVARNNKAVKTAIKTGLEDENRVEVQEGLKEGEMVITSNLNELFDGREIFLFGKEQHS